MKAAAKHANSTTFLVRVAKQLGHGMRQSSRLKDMAAVPDLWDVLVMDMVIARYQYFFFLLDFLFLKLILVFYFFLDYDYCTMNVLIKTTGMSRIVS